MRRRNEEPVEAQEREKAGDDRGGAAERHRDDQDGDEIEHRDVGERRAARLEADEHGGDRDRGNRGDVRHHTPHHRLIVSPQTVAASLTPGIASPAATLVNAAVSRTVAAGKRRWTSARTTGIALEPPV